MQQTAEQGITQNPEAILHRIVRSQQNVVNVSGGLVPPIGTGTRSGLNSPAFESGAPTSPMGKRWASPTPRAPLVQTPATPPGGAPPSAGLGNLSTESTGTGGVETRIYEPHHQQQVAMKVVELATMSSRTRSGWSPARLDRRPFQIQKSEKSRKAEGQTQSHHF